MGEAIADVLVPMQEEKAHILKDKQFLNDVMKKGAEAASRIARRTLSKVYRKVGFYQGE